MHTFCFKCLNGYFKCHRPGEEVRCPLCRKEFRLPSGGVACIQKNYYIRGLTTAKKEANAMRVKQGQMDDKFFDAMIGFNRCQTAIVAYRGNGRQVCRDIRRIANELKEHHMRVEMARVGTVVIGIATGTAAIIGTVVSVATAGLLAPVAVAVVSASAAGASALAGVAAQGIGKLIEREGVADALRRISEMDTERKRVIGVMRGELNKCECCKQLHGPIELTLQLLGDTYDRQNSHQRQSGASLLTSAAQTGMVAAPSAARFARLLGPVGIAFGLVRIGMNIHPLVDTAINVNIEVAGEAYQCLCDIADIIESDLEHIDEAWAKVPV